MSNPFEEINSKLDVLIEEVAKLKGAAKPTPLKITFTEFCRINNITRQTGYSWASRGLIKIEKVGSRNFVPLDSVKVTKKYQRELFAA